MFFIGKETYWKPLQAPHATAKFTLLDQFPSLIQTYQTTTYMTLCKRYKGKAAHFIKWTFRQSVRYRLRIYKSAHILKYTCKNETEVYRGRLRLTNLRPSKTGLGHILVLSSPYLVLKPSNQRNRKSNEFRNFPKHNINFF